MRILIVEDESLLANRLATTLGERGYVVDIATESAATFSRAPSHTTRSFSISGCRVSTG
jgi:DNA-binding response OmpR family regulator